MCLWRNLPSRDVWKALVHTNNTNIGLCNIETTLYVHDSLHMQIFSCPRWVAKKFGIYFASALSSYSEWVNKRGGVIYLQWVGLMRWRAHYRSAILQKKVCDKQLKGPNGVCRLQRPRFDFFCMPTSPFYRLKLFWCGSLSKLEQHSIQDRHAWHAVGYRNEGSGT